MSLLYRARTLDDGIVAHSTYSSYNSGGVLLGTSPQATTFRTRFGEFQDWVNGGRAVKPAYHIEFRSAPAGRPNLLHVPTGAHDTITGGKYYYPPVKATLQQLFGVPSAAQRTALADQAFDALVPQIPQEVSLPNFLYELRELADLVPKIEESLIKQASGGYLTYSFGYKPLIGDLRKLANLLDTVAARLQYLRDTWGRETRISFESTWEATLPSEISLPNASDVGFLYRRLSFRGIYRAGGYLFHMLEDLDGKIGLLRGLTGALGFNNPLGVLWEAVPFSFVVDWFSRAGNALSRTAVQPFVGPWELHRVTHSYSFSGEWSLDAIFPSGFSPVSYEADRGTCVGYQRVIGLPVPAGFLNTEGLTSNQQMLAAALIGSSLP